ncbi:MAG TPA: hypothetical protein VMO26_17605 [Vicinamibacterales bacterium]|nr:hypothetical protein [Vicinamibacterales bacterium]
MLTDIDSTLAVSPDGRRLAYLRENFPEPGESAVVIADSGGANVRAVLVKRPPLFVSPGFFVAPSWSPDGTRLAVGVRNSETRDAGFVTVDVETGREDALSGRFGSSGFTFWLPDGSGILVTAQSLDAMTPQGGGPIHLLPYPRGEPRRITNDLVVYRNATVSDDGRLLVTVGSELAPTLWLIPLDGGEPRRLRSERHDGASGAAWMPDGRILITTSVSGDTHVAIMNGDGSNRRVLTADGHAGWAGHCVRGPLR